MSRERRGKRAIDNVVYPGMTRQLRPSNLLNSSNTSSLVPPSSAPLKNIESNLFTGESKSKKYDVSEPQHLFELDWVALDTHESDGPSGSSSNNFPAREKRRISTFQHSLKQPVKTKDMSSDPRSTMSSPYLVNDSSSIELGNQVEEHFNDWHEASHLDGDLVGPQAEVKRTLNDDFNQLDEPIIQTLMRDLTGIYSKMKIIALPLSSYDIYKVVLRGWDLWGPLLLCTFLAFSLHHSEVRDRHPGPQFADVFVLVWFGSFVVSLNYRLLSISSLNSRSAISKSIVKSADGEPMSLSSSTSIADTYDKQQNLGRDIGSSRSSMAKILMPSDDNSFKTLLSPPSLFQLMCVFGYCLVAPCFGLLLLKLLSFEQLLFERVIVGLLLGFAWPTICANRILIRYQHPEKRNLASYPIALFYFILSCMIILNH